MEKADDSIKLFNVRYLPLFAAFFLLGIFCVKVSITVAAVLWTVAAFCAAALLFGKRIKAWVAVALVAALFVGFGAAKAELYYRNKVGLGGKTEVSCRVVSVEENDGVYTVVADSLCRDRSYSGEAVFSTEQALAPGDRIRVYGEISIRPLSLDSLSEAMKYRKGYKYQIESAEVLSVTEGNPPLNLRIREGARNLLIEKQGERAGGFSYAMMFGDAEYMEEADKTAMREVGVAHVFAISGLHIGVLAGALLFLLRKLKVKDGVSLLILLLIFGFYAYLVGFTPSVLRAAIMVSVGLLASHFGARYDDISALSFAAILILIVRPLLLFDLSFIMSFLSIFGLHSLSRPLKKAFQNKGVKEKLAEALSLSIATTIALLPVSAVVFGRISLVGFLLNLVVVPLASVSYVITLIGVLLTAVIPSFGAVLCVTALLPRAISEVSAWAASLGFTAKYNFSAAEILVYYAVLLFVGKYSLAAKKVKLVAGGMGAGVLALLIFAV